MSGHPIDVAGIVLPSSTPAFLALIAVHVAAGLGAVVSGVWAMLATKGPGRHPRAGSIYYWSLTVVASTMAVLAALRWAEDKHLFVLGLLSIAAATVGRTAMRHRWRHSLPTHIIFMATSYILMLTAFYVDNGKSLPLWKNLPPIAYWLLPSVVGVPLVARALRKHTT